MDLKNYLGSFSNSAVHVLRSRYHTMFPIIRYGVNEEVSPSSNKDSVLKALRKSAKKKAKALKRKSSITEDCNTKAQKREANDDNIKAKELSPVKADKDEVVEQQSPVEKGDEKASGKHDTKNVHAEVNNRNGDDRILDVDSPKEYNPLQIFKLGLKAPKQVLGFETSNTATCKLPEWLENPFYIQTDVNVAQKFDMSCFDDLILRNLQSAEIKHLFPVQASLIPAILYGIECDLINRPNDICVCSPTGSGKTLAFVIPIVQYLLRSKTNGTKALVVVPTIELAKQVHSVFSELSKGSSIKSVLLGAGQVQNELHLLRKKTKLGFDLHPDIIVSTPGRLSHFLEIANVLNFNDLRFLVIDEADRILDLIKQSWLQKLKLILPQWQTTMNTTLTDLSTPKPALQKLLFSATLNTDPETLKDLDLFQPRLFIARGEVKSHLPVKSVKYTTPTTLREYMVCCEANLKPLIVISLLINLNVKKALCFTKTAESARRLHLLLNEYAKAQLLAVPCLEFSSLLTKKDRKRNMSIFTSKKDCVLVCSDAVARGIDAVDIEIVVLYDVPQFIEAYIHRAGRASRAGKEGSVYSLITPAEMFHYKKLFKSANRHLPQNFQFDQDLISKLSEEYEKALSSVQSSLADYKKLR